MLLFARYIVILFLVTVQLGLASLAAGNFASGKPLGLFYTVNAFICMLGFIVTIFVGLLVVTELIQKERSTTSVGFELFWAIFVWAACAVEANYSSSDRPQACILPSGSGSKWDVCGASWFFVPLSWISMFLAMAHIAVLILAVQWHHDRAMISKLDVLQELPGSSHRKRPNVLRRTSQAIRGVFRDEVGILFPILRRSTHNLLRERFLGASSETKASAQSLASGPKKIQPRDHKAPAKGKKAFGRFSSASSFGCTSSPRFLDIPIPSPAPIYEAHHHRAMSSSRYRARDDTRNSKFNIVPETLPRFGPTVSPAGDPHQCIPRIQPHQTTRVTPLHPQTFKRSLTIPSALSPSRSRFPRQPHSNTDVHLSRSRTFASTKRTIPSRYEGLDLSSYMAAPRLPDPSSSHLPQSNVRYV